jgi:hypothetical protein
MHNDRLSYDRDYFYSDPGDAGLEALREAGIRYRTKIEVCSHCGGRGVRALHGMAISGEALEDTEFMADYMGGKYDSQCTDCKGRNVVEVVDLDSLPPDAKNVYRRAVREERARSGRVTPSRSPSYGWDAKT